MQIACFLSYINPYIFLVLVAANNIGQFCYSIVIFRHFNRLLIMPNNKNEPLIHLGFRRFEPSILLSEFVDCYWFINTDNDKPIYGKEYMHPEGGFGIILNYADPLHFDGIKQTAPYILDGTNTITRELSLNGVLNAVGIRFKAAGAHLLFSLPLSELKNEIISLKDTPLRKIPNLYSELALAKAFSTKVKIIEDWLYKSLLSTNTSDLVKQSLQLIKNQQGMIAIESVAKKFNCNLRQIERLFNTQVGMTPKEYSRNLRIKIARASIKSNNLSLTEIAHHLGYFDQAHFSNQFKKVTGITPGTYLKKTSKSK